VKDLGDRVPDAPSRPPKVTVYYDGACEPRNPGGVAAYGFVVYAGGRKIGEGRGLAMAKPWSSEASNNVAEYSAMINAFKWLIENGYGGADVVVKGDSQLSIRQMQGVYAVRAPRIIPLHQEAKRLAAAFRSVRFQWIPREENREADMLSELALRDYWREYKAEEAREIRPEEVKPLSGSRFRVRGYTVDLEEYTCECPDYRRANSNPRLRVKLPCKHIIAAESAYAGGRRSR
jgi:ribonuclease HI